VAKRVRAYIGLGSNLGDREASLQLALSSLARLSAVRIEAVSRVYESEAVGPGKQGRYLNAAVEISCEQTAVDLLEALLAIELVAGRDRGKDVERWTARTLDLDLLLYGDDGDLCIDEPGLSVPHPRLHERNFVLGPLCDLAPDLVHPREGVSVSELADKLTDLSALQVWPRPLDITG
jgi:2-amino-4-hydroxy-6-hydroxymethyldihydropteridine diphosphokinase